MIAIINGTVKGDVKSYRNEQGDIFMYKFAVIEKRREVDCRNGRCGDSWNVTVREKDLFDDCRKLTDGTIVYIQGRAESNCVSKKCDCGEKVPQYFTEIIADDLKMWGVK